MQQEQEGSLFFIAPPEIAKDFAKEFDITVKEAQDILDGGFDTVTQFLNIRALEDENAFESTLGSSKYRARHSYFRLFTPSFTLGHCRIQLKKTYNIV